MEAKMQFSAKRKSSKIKRISHQGFTLTEVLVATSIITSLCCIAIPTYIDQKKVSCQNQSESIMAQAMLQAQSFNDEYGAPATGWSDLNKISTLMTASGPAKGSSFNWIELPSCGYKLKGSKDETLYTFEATTKGATVNPPNGEEANSENEQYNIVGCINVATGASDIRRGNMSKPTSTSDLKCS